MHSILSRMPPLGEPPSAFVHKRYLVDSCGDMRSKWTPINIKDISSPSQYNFRDAEGRSLYHFPEPVDRCFPSERPEEMQPQGEQGAEQSNHRRPFNATANSSSSMQRSQIFGTDKQSYSYSVCHRGSNTPPPISLPPIVEEPRQASIIKAAAPPQSPYCDNSPKRASEEFISLQTPPPVAEGPQFFLPPAYLLPQTPFDPSTLRSLPNLSEFSSNRRKAMNSFVRGAAASSLFEPAQEAPLMQARFGMECHNMPDSEHVWKRHSLPTSQFMSQRIMSIQAMPPPRDNSTAPVQLPPISHLLHGGLSYVTSRSPSSPSHQSANNFPLMTPRNQVELGHPLKFMPSPDRPLGCLATHSLVRSCPTSPIKPQMYVGPQESSQIVRDHIKERNVHPTQPTPQQEHTTQTPTASSNGCSNSPRQSGRRTMSDSEKRARKAAQQQHRRKYGPTREARERFSKAEDEWLLSEKLLLEREPSRHWVDLEIAHKSRFPSKNFRTLSGLQSRFYRIKKKADLAAGMIQSGPNGNPNLKARFDNRWDEVKGYFPQAQNRDSDGDSLSGYSMRDVSVETTSRPEDTRRI